MSETDAPTLEDIVSDYISTVQTELHSRIEKWELDTDSIEIQDAIGGLLARQVSLTTQMARNPYIWNGHIGPMILRAMVDLYINFAWILEAPLERSRRFILHGLGQEKLLLENLKTELPADDEFLKQIEGWINSQRYTFLTEVNVGSWSDTDTRKMAESIGCLDLYRGAYQPFSAATHSMWNHVGKYNLHRCPNPLHGPHRIPGDPEFEPDIYYLEKAAKYLDKTFVKFDEKIKLSMEQSQAYEKLCTSLTSLTDS